MDTKNVLIVDSVDKNSEAERVGLRSGDVLISYDGVAISGEKQNLLIIMQKVKGKESVILNVLRNNQTVSLTIKTGPLGLSCSERYGDVGIGSVNTSNVKTKYESSLPTALSIIGWLNFFGSFILALYIWNNFTSIEVGYRTVTNPLGVVAGFLVLIEGIIVLIYSSAISLTLDSVLEIRNFLEKKG